MIRVLDILISFFGLIILTPIFIIISFLITFESKGGVFYLQVRVGKNGNDFKLFKFRTMVKNSEQQGSLTVGFRDKRITRIGFFLRRYKLDELPQLINVLIGNMSMVGPRPEIRKYVDLYNPEQRAVLKIKPGVTDAASIKYSDENALLGRSENPEQTYIEEIMPAKLKLNLIYVRNQSVNQYLSIIIITIAHIFKIYRIP
jgi:lipopolysaccharide/colanic/teichoic acid biosynthesis glycosyltransferase